MAGQRLWKYAETRARESGVCFVHERSDGPPVFALLTIERYEELIHSVSDHGDTSVLDPWWEHDHATPEMVGFVVDVTNLD